MEKLKLALENLVVESFAPAVEPQQTGTVHAHNSGPFTDECQSCGVYTGCGAGECTADVSCNGSCGCPTNGTCYGYYTCDPMNTCQQVDTCYFPQCTALGEIC